MESTDLVIGVFTDQAYNVILLAEDEARMLGGRKVEPEHVLLAAARGGNVERLLSTVGVTATDVHRAIVAADGLGEDLAVGPVRHSSATDAALRKAVDAAAQRGTLSPSSEHVLLGLVDDVRVRSILAGLGIADAPRLVDEAYPARPVPIARARVDEHAQRARHRTPPQPGPIVPVFERFTTHAQAAITAAERVATALSDECVAPWHLLLGVLHVADGVAAVVMSRHGVTLPRATERAQLLDRPRVDAPSGIFSEEARWVIAQGSLKHAYGTGHWAIGTGHLLLAALDSADSRTREILGPGVIPAQLAREVIRELPGGEHA